MELVDNLEYVLAKVVEHLQVEVVEAVEAQVVEFVKVDLQGVDHVVDAEEVAHAVTNQMKWK